MPVVLRFGRFSFVIHPMDHRPAHVHVLAEGAEAKFDIATGKCITCWGFSRKTVGRLEKIVKANQDLLMEAWNEYKGQK